MGLFDKVDRAVSAQRARNRDMGITPAVREEEGPKLEKKDFFSMWLAAMVTIFPAALGALLFLAGIAWLLIPK